MRYLLQLQGRVWGTHQMQHHACKDHLAHTSRALPSLCLEETTNHSSPPAERCRVLRAERYRRTNRSDLEATPHARTPHTLSPPSARTPHALSPPHMQITHACTAGQARQSLSAHLNMQGSCPQAALQHNRYALYPSSPAIHPAFLATHPTRPAAQLQAKQPCSTSYAPCSTPCSTLAWYALHTMHTAASSHAPRRVRDLPTHRCRGNVTVGASPGCQGRAGRSQVQRHHYSTHCKRGRRESPSQVRAPPACRASSLCPSNGRCRPSAMPITMRTQSSVAVHCAIHNAIHCAVQHDRPLPRSVPAFTPSSPDMQLALGPPSWRPSPSSARPCCQVNAACVPSPNSALPLSHQDSTAHLHHKVQLVHLIHLGKRRLGCVELLTVDGHGRQRGPHAGVLQIQPHTGAPSLVPCKPRQLQLCTRPRQAQPLATH